VVSLVWVPARAIAWALDSKTLAADTAFDRKSFEEERVPTADCPWGTAFATDRADEAFYTAASERIEIDTSRTSDNSTVDLLAML
jgi:hypothetical protein